MGLRLCQPDDPRAAFTLQRPVALSRKRAGTLFTVLVEPSHSHALLPF